MNTKPNYANWVPKKLIILLGLSSVVFVAAFAASLFPSTSVIWIIIRIVSGLAACFFLFFFAYMSYARKLLSYEGGCVQGKILDNVLRYLEWDGNGQLLDIGCGSGAMTIKAAKKYPQAKLVGMDYWGPGWDYAKSQCERNADIEDVADAVTFQKGDAAHLDYADETFDAAVSNFVFHEVRSQPDKTALIKEALRVIKPGGVFSFSDVYYSRGVYKD
jgi:SAM-dependent methyltransferase